MWQSEQEHQVVPIDHRRKVMKAQRKSGRRGSYQQPLVDYLNQSLGGYQGVYPSAIKAQGHKAFLKTTIQIFPTGSNVPQAPIVHQGQPLSKPTITDYHDQELTKPPKEKRRCFLFRKKKPKMPSEKHVPLKYQKPPKEITPQLSGYPADNQPYPSYSKSPKQPKPPKEPKIKKVKTESEKRMAYQNRVRESFSYIYTAFLATLFILVNLACIALQVVLVIRKSAYYGVYAAFWVSQQPKYYETHFSLS